MRRSILAGAVAAVAALPASTAHAAVVSCGQTVTTSITVSNDLSGCAGHGLIVGAHGITIDFDGHSIEGIGNNFGVLSNGFNGVTVKNGTVRNFGTGVRGANVNGMRVYWMTVGTTFRGVHFTNAINSTVDRVHSSDAAFAAHVIGAGNTVRRSTLAESVVGLQGNGSSGRYENNIVLGNGTGMSVTGGSLTVYFNEVRNSAGDGIVASLSGGTLDRNTVTGSGGDGIQITYAGATTTVRRNVVSANGADGLRIDDGHGDTVVRENVARDNGNWGIAGFDVVDGGENVASGNGQAAQCIGVVCS